MKSNSLNIIIPTFNRAGILRQTLPLNAKIAFEHNCKIYVVDNASSDGTAEFLSEIKRQWPNTIHLAPNDNNIGLKGTFLKIVFKLHSVHRPTMIISDEDLLVENDLDRLIQKVYLEIEKSTVNGCIFFNWLNHNGHQCIFRRFDRKYTRWETVEPLSLGLISGFCFHGDFSHHRAFIEAQVLDVRNCYPHWSLFGDDILFKTSEIKAIKIYAPSAFTFLENEWSEKAGHLSKLNVKQYCEYHSELINTIDGDNFRKKYQRVSTLFRLRSEGSYIKMCFSILLEIRNFNDFLPYIKKAILRR